MNLIQSAPLLSSVPLDQNEIEPSRPADEIEPSSPLVKFIFWPRPTDRSYNLRLKEKRSNVTIVQNALGINKEKFTLDEASRWNLRSIKKQDQSYYYKYQSQPKNIFERIFSAARPYLVIEINEASVGIVHTAQYFGYRTLSDSYQPLCDGLGQTQIAGIILCEKEANRPKTQWTTEIYAYPNLRMTGGCFGKNREEYNKSEEWVFYPSEIPRSSEPVMRTSWKNIQLLNLCHKNLVPFKKVHDLADLHQF